MGHGVARTREPHRLAIDTDDAGVESVGAEDCARGLRPSGADQPGEPQDLAVMDGERDVNELNGVRILRGAPTCQALDFERDRTGLRDRPFSVERPDVPADHHPNDGVDIRVGDLA